MSFFLRPTTLSLGLTSVVTLSAPLLLYRHNRHVSPLSLLRLHTDSSASSSPARDWSYTSNAKTPVFESGGKLNRRAVKQLSVGSVLGVLAGVAVSIFSKPLAILLGLAIFGVQAVESRGIHIVPYGMIQRYFKGFDARSAVQDNVAFKLAFGATFALAAFAEF